MQMSIGEIVLDVDVEATRHSYATIVTPGPEECGCAYCRNWLVQRESAYPQSVRELLIQMGIRFGFETEVWDVPSADYRRFCSGWYPFIGHIVKKAENQKIEDMEVWISEGLSYSVPWLVSNNAHELHFSTIVDWILNGPEPS